MTFHRFICLAEWVQSYFLAITLACLVLWEGVGSEALVRLQNGFKNDGMQLRFLKGRLSYFGKVYGLL